MIKTNQKTIILQAFTRYLYNEKHLPMARAKRCRDAIADGRNDKEAIVAFRAFKKAHPECFKLF